jgi:hypothetical protein
MNHPLSKHPVAEVGRYSDAARGSDRSETKGDGRKLHRIKAAAAWPCRNELTGAQPSRLLVGDASRLRSSREFFWHVSQPHRVA